EEVHAALTAVVGIGPWTADVYIMFCLGRADAWAPGDLALQIAVQRALALAERPDKDDMMTLAERWRPWRGVAARLLLAYYAALKAKSMAVPVGQAPSRNAALRRLAPSLGSLGAIGAGAVRPADETAAAARAS